MVSQVNEAVEKLEQIPGAIEAVREAFEEGAITRERFIEGIDTLLPGDLLARCDASARRNIELCIIYEATRLQRAEMVARLDSHGLEVRGDLEWRYIASKCGGPVGYYDDLSPYYRATAVNLNSTSLQMRWTVNQRVFDCPAAGGFLISDNQKDLAEFFELGVEAVAYESLDELEEKVRFYSARPSARESVVRRAQTRVLSCHTHAHRLKSLEGFLRERYA